jgi:hypothetical protein
MRLHISDYQVTYGAQGEPTVALYSGKRHVADVRFREAPQQRFNEDFETRFITLEIATGERAALMDLLRNERAVTIDTEAPNLVFRR